MIEEKAYAKINLFLDVLRRRADGYHDIGTLFQTVDACDLVRAEDDPAGEIGLKYSVSQDYPVETDLVFRAAELLKARYRVRRGVRLFLDKRLPLGAGLGGGSADAAAALRALNRLWGLKLSSQELELLGAELGADVPFLVRGGSALATGIGEQLECVGPVKMPSGTALLIATPHCAVPTRVAYGGITPSGEERWMDFAEHVLGLSAPWSCLDVPWFNKFEETVLPQYPLIREIRGLLEEYGALRALMSGSGASVFALMESPEAARRAQEKIFSRVRWSWIGTFMSGIGE